MATSKQPKQWRQFEEFVASIQRQLAPKATVQHDERIVGKSGVARQIDVTVREHIGQYQMFIAIDCKNWRRPVDIADVGAFADLVEDVRANKGAMVCNAGFTSGAKKRAKEKGIDLFKAIDPKSIDWPSYIAFPTVGDCRGIKSFRIKFVHSRPGPFAMPAVAPKYLEIYRKNGSFMGLLGNLHLDAWHNGKLPREPGEHLNVKFMTEDAYTKVKGVIYGPVEITTSITIQQRLFFGSLPIEEGRGFADEQSGAFMSNSVTTGKLDVVEMEKNWQRIQNVSELSVKPVLTIFFLDCYPPVKLPAQD